MEELWVVVAGACAGVVLIAVLNAFPGEPFDYEKGVPVTEQPSQRPLACLVQDYAQREREVELAAQQLKCDKLQALLGLEKREIEQMIRQAKADAIEGRQSRHTPADYTRWIDYLFYCIFIILIALVMRAEYSVDVVQMLAYAFPREVETVRKIVSLAPTRAFFVGGE